MAGRRQTACNTILPPQVGRLQRSLDTLDGYFTAILSPIYRKQFKRPKWSAAMPTAQQSGAIARSPRMLDMALSGGAVWTVATNIRADCGPLGLHCSEKSRCAV